MYAICRRRMYVDKSVSLTELARAMFNPKTPEYGDLRRRLRDKILSVIAHVAPDPPGHRLAFRQDRHRGFVAVQTFGRQHMRFDQAETAA